MTELTLEKVACRLDEGSNPVEVAGYGRESTHKGYLTWLLNTSHWTEAKEGLCRLVEAADWSGGERGSATGWIRKFPEEFWCEYERTVGSKKVDLIVTAGHDDSSQKSLPIELKTDSVAGGNQLSEMSVGPGQDVGLVLLLGSSAVRDDSIPKEIEKRGCFAPVTVDRILTVWEGLEASMPRVGRDWLEALRHENLRLNNAFDLTPKQRETYWCYGYRSDKHLFYALLNAVREILNEHDSGGCWSLRDGGYNTVLNLEPWKLVADGNASVYWEFNDNQLALKVEQCGKDKITRKWVEETQNIALNLGPSCKVKPRKARAGSTYMSVIRWPLYFDTAHSVAERSWEIINLFNRELQL